MSTHEQPRDETRLAGQKKLWKEWLGGNAPTKRLLLALGFWILLTCFFHFKEVRMEIPEVGTLAPRYVISQTNFDFLDEEASQMIRQEGVRDIGAIYRLDESEVRLFRHQLENSLIENQKWRHDLKRSTFEEVYLFLDRIEEQMVQFRFTDDRTLRRMHRLQLPTGDFFNLTFSSSQVDGVFLPKGFWEELEKSLSDADRESLETVRFLVNPFAKHKWKLQQDFSLERSIRKRVQSQIPDRYTHVEAGTSILKQREKVTSRHLSMMLAMKEQMARTQRAWNTLSLLGNAILSFGLVFFSLLYLYYFQKEFSAR